MCILLDFGSVRVERSAEGAKEGFSKSTSLLLCTLYGVLSRVCCPLCFTPSARLFAAARGAGEERTG